MKLSEKLLQLRESKGMTQRQVYDATGITDVTISRYENNLRIPTLENAKILSKLYGVSLDELTDCDIAI